MLECTWRIQVEKRFLRFTEFITKFAYCDEETECLGSIKNGSAFGQLASEERPNVLCDCNEVFHWKNSIEMHLSYKEITRKLQERGLWNISRCNIFTATPESSRKTELELENSIYQAIAFATSHCFVQNKQEHSSSFSADLSGSQQIFSVSISHLKTSHWNDLKLRISMQESQWKSALF